MIAFKAKRYSWGFTLVEVMVALLILTIMMAIAASSLFIIIKTKERLEQRVQRFEQLQIALVLLYQDISQIVNRPIVNGRGETEFGFIGTLKERPYIEFTRLGYSNPFATITRSDLQRISYEVKNQQLIRTVWPVLDRAPTTTAVSYVILDHIQSFEVRYLTDDLQFYSLWPPPIKNYAILKKPLPKALEITIHLIPTGQLRQLIAVDGSGFVD